MKQDVRPIVWRDWTLFGLKWVLLLLFCAAVYVTRTQEKAVEPMSGLILAFTVGAVANAVLALLIIAAYAPAVPPLVAIGDIITAGVFIQLAQGNPLLNVGIAGGLMLSGVLRLGPVWGTFQIIGVMASIFVVHSITMGAAWSRLLSSGEFTLPFITLVALGLVALAADFVLDRQMSAQEKRITELVKGETAELQFMRERTRAIYELSTTISSTLNYDKILSAVLDAGRLALRDETGQAFTSAVMLFRAEDNALHVVSNRGLTRADEAVVVQGTEGLIGRALKEAVPMFAKTVRKDPELQYFTAFQFVRSFLCVPLRAGYDNYGVLLYGSEAADAFDAGQSDLLIAIGSQATIAMQNAVLYRSLAEEKERIVEVEEDARKKLARDLHDGPTQSVAAIAMRMSIISRLMEKNPSQVPEELKKVEDIARRTTKEIRHMLFTLRPLVLETQGITAALAQLAEKMQETHGQAVATRVGRDVEGVMDAHQQGVLFYIVEEAVNNARKHAQAELISVTVGRQEKMIICQIADNGLGFDTKAVNTNYEKRGSLGMVNMRERAELLDGTMQLESTPGKGTVITFFLPIKTSRPDSRTSTSGKNTTKLALAAVERFNGNPR